MKDGKRLVDLGFVSARVPAGSHICQIYSDSVERDHALLNFLSSGLRAGEKTACFWADFDENSARDWFAAEQIAFDDERASGHLSTSCAESVYFENGHFAPERVLELLVAFHEAAIHAGHPGARVIGEMSPRIREVEGGARLFEYESRVNAVIRQRPVTAVCQYDARAFDGATIMDVLSVHPMMVIHGNVVQNPFFTPPEQFAYR